MHHSKVQERLDDIEDMFLPPDQFVEKHIITPSQNMQSRKSIEHNRVSIERDMFSANNLSGDESIGVRFCEPVQKGRELQNAAEAKGNVIEIEERIQRRDYEKFPGRDESMVRNSFLLMHYRGARRASQVTTV